MSQMNPAFSRTKKSKSNRELLELLKENSLNWYDVESKDGYKLPSTLDPHSWCGQWIWKGCMNVSGQKLFLYINSSWRIMIKCISCKKSNFIKFSDTSRLKLPVFQCQNCNLLITGTSTEELKKAIGDMYTNEYWEFEDDYAGIRSSEESEFTDVVSQGKRRNFISQYLYIEKYLKIKNSKNKKILEIGSGRGQTTFWLDQMGFEVLGIEPDRKNVSIVNQKLNNSKLIESNIEDFKNSDTYDVIWVSHVLEHLLDPIEFLQQIKVNLNEEGILFIEVPNCENLSILKNSIIEPHIWHFSRNSLQNICREVDFDIVVCDVFRPAKKSEAIKNKIFRSNKTIYPYYPRIITDEKSGRDLRIILKKKT